MILSPIREIGVECRAWKLNDIHAFRNFLHVIMLRQDDEHFFKNVYNVLAILKLNILWYT
jgi:hypothetical protein